MITVPITDGSTQTNPKGMYTHGGIFRMASLSGHYELAVTLPCHNDSHLLPRAVKLLEEATRSMEHNFVLVIAEDGSESYDVVRKLVQEYKNILYFHNKERLGKGKALMDAWEHVEADTYLFMDVDMATDLWQMNAYTNLLEKRCKHGFDLVTGSRYHHESKVYRPIIRWLASVIYNKIVRLLFGSKLTDHQCGFKVFSAHLIHTLSPFLTSSHWLWDTEIIILAQRMRFKVAEIPVFWVEMKDPSTQNKRLLTDIWLFAIGILRLLWKIRPSTSASSNIR